MLGGDVACALTDAADAVDQRQVVLPHDLSREDWLHEMAAAAIGAFLVSIVEQRKGVRRRPIFWADLEALAEALKQHEQQRQK